MTEENRIDYSGAVVAARKGDEDSFEFLYNQTILKYRAVCMKYFDAATVEGRTLTDETIQEIYVRIYEGLKTLADPADFATFGLAVAERVCRRKAAVAYAKEAPADAALRLEQEPYIGVGAAAQPAGTASAGAPQEPLATATECRGEVRREPAYSNHDLGRYVLGVLHLLDPVHRLELLLWNGDYTTAGIAREVNRPEDLVLSDLRGTFARVEKAIMDLEEVEGVDALRYAKYRLSFFNMLLDRYNRFYEAEARSWEELEANLAEAEASTTENTENYAPAAEAQPSANAEDPAGGTAAKTEDNPEARNMFGRKGVVVFEQALKESLTEDSMLVDPDKTKMAFEDLPEEQKESPATFRSVWNAVRHHFYLRNDPVAIGHREREESVLDGLEGNYEDYLGGTEEPEQEATFTEPVHAEDVTEDRDAPKHHFLSTWWGKLIIGLIIIVVVLAVVVATAGTHTSHAAVSANAVYTAVQSAGVSHPAAAHLFCVL